jgi:transposase-like protein
MKRRQWTAQEKMSIVFEGLSNQESLSSLCNRHQISQTQYYQWKERLMSDGYKVFERGGVDNATDKLKTENRNLKIIIGDLTAELKKNEF